MKKFKVYKPAQRLSGMSPRAWTLVEYAAIFVALAAAFGLIAMVVL